MLPFSGTARRLSAIERTLVSWNIKYERKHDGSLVVPGDIDLSHRKLDSLPDFSSVTVLGDFNCAHNRLTTLKGSPRAVHGYFNCQHNELISLEGAPQAVKYFACYCNKLTSLKYAPQQAVNFACGSNQLRSLKYAPQTVSGIFTCDDNALTSLEHAPEAVPQFYCERNPLVSLKGAPKKFSNLRSDFGTFTSPEELALFSDELKQRREQQMASRATVLQEALRVGKPLKFRHATPAAFANPNPA